MPIFKKTKCRMKWCYSPSRHKDGTCDKICTYNTVYVQTNADRIRAMTDEELAVFLSQTEEHLFTGNLWNIKTWNEWLKKEVDDDRR